MFKIELTTNDGIAMEVTEHKTPCILPENIQGSILEA